MDGMAFFGKFSGNDRAAESGANAEVVWHLIVSVGEETRFVEKSSEDRKRNMAQGEIFSDR
jgi:hypothetical protein